MLTNKLLLNVPIFSNLDDNQISFILSKMTKKNYSKSEIILMEDEVGDTFFIILEGSVKVTRDSEDGREVILAVLSSGNFFGEISLLDGKTRSANAIAVEKTSLMILKRNDFLQLINEIPQISISLLSELAKRIRKTDEQVENLAFSDAEKRIGISILSLSEQLGVIKNGLVKIPKLPFHQDIANMSGTSRETVSRMLKLLETKKLIKRNSHELSFVDYNKFKSYFL
tara:strand:- start:17453 stop:18133 length:681 start_codon:yes stop_codon:yes gene_type:complete